MKLPSEVEEHNNFDLLDSLDWLLLLNWNNYNRKKGLNATGFTSKTKLTPSLKRKQS